MLTIEMYKHLDFIQIAREAKLQGYELFEKRKGFPLAYLIYRGPFGGKHNFAYATLSSMGDENRKEVFSWLHDQIQEAW